MWLLSKSNQRAIAVASTPGWGAIIASIIYAVIIFVLSGRPWIGSCAFLFSLGLAAAWRIVGLLTVILRPDILRPGGGGIRG